MSAVTVSDSICGVNKNKDSPRRVYRAALLKVKESNHQLEAAVFFSFLFLLFFSDFFWLGDLVCSAGLGLPPSHGALQDKIIAL